MQLAHPDFVILGEDGGIVGGAKRNAVLAEVTRQPLVGLYPATGKLRTWTIAAVRRRSRWTSSSGLAGPAAGRGPCRPG